MGMNRLRKLRQERRLSQAQVARALGYEGYGPIGAYERGERELSLRSAIGYSLLFDVAIADLVPGLVAEVRASIWTP
jgi:transcriptional regulator with XRE-family HTH domain